MKADYICDGCNVRGVHLHKCHFDGCTCNLCNDILAPETVVTLNKSMESGKAGTFKYTYKGKYKERYYFNAGGSEDIALTKSQAIDILLNHQIKQNI